MTAMVDDRYSVNELVAAGGMADVYRGHDRVLGRQVAIKRLRGATNDPAARERFAREARLLARFSHPNAVAVYDAVDDTADGPLIVMEYVEGVTLRAHLRHAGRLPVEEATDIADQLLRALAAAHAQGIVHRDIKPGNVLIAPDGHVKLADFGIATMIDASDVTATGELVGTPKYLSPEQALGQRASPQSDLYAVGVLLFEMVCGRAPFEADSPMATMVAHQREPVPSLRTRCAAAPDWYIAVVERALAKRPDDRFPDAGSMRVALRAGRADTETIADSMLALPVTIEPGAAGDADAFGFPTATGVRRSNGAWAVVLFALLGVLVAAGVWALGDHDGSTAVVPEPTSAPVTLPTTAATIAVPQVPAARGGGGANAGAVAPLEQESGSSGRGAGDSGRGKDESGRGKDASGRGKDETRPPDQTKKGQG